MAAQFPFSFMTEKSKAADDAPSQPAVEPIVEAVPETAPQDSTSAQPAPDTQAPFANSGAWWDVLQNQFKQVVNSVMAAEAAIPKAQADVPKSTVKASATPKAKAASGKTRAKAGTKSSPKTGGDAKLPLSTGDAKVASAPRKRKSTTK